MYEQKATARIIHRWKWRDTWTETLKISFKLSWWQWKRKKKKEFVCYQREGTSCVSVCVLIDSCPEHHWESLVPFFSHCPLSYLYTFILHQAFCLSKSFMQKTYKFAISLPKLLIKDLECGKRKECWPAQGRRRDLCQDSLCSCTFEKDRRM